MVGFLLLFITSLAFLLLFNDPTQFLFIHFLQLFSSLSLFQTTLAHSLITFHNQILITLPMFLSFLQSFLNTLSQFSLLVNFLLLASSSFFYCFLLNSSSLQSFLLTFFTADQGLYVFFDDQAALCFSSYYSSFSALLRAEMRRREKESEREWEREGRRTGKRELKVLRHKRAFRTRKATFEIRPFAFPFRASFSRSSNSVERFYSVFSFSCSSLFVLCYNDNETRYTRLEESVRVLQQDAGKRNVVKWFRRLAIMKCYALNIRSSFFNLEKKVVIFFFPFTFFWFRKIYISNKNIFYTFFPFLLLSTRMTILVELWGPFYL